MLDLAKERIMVTGGAGFLGSHVIERLRQEGAEDIHAPTRQAFDLTHEREVQALYAEVRPTVVFHLAGRVGGIAANQSRPGEFFYQNLMMGTLTVHYAMQCGAKKVVSAAAGCGYPEHVAMPQRESDFWNGLPQTESAPYSLAKRLLHVQSMAYWNQYRFNADVVIPGNLYGPRDNFHLTDAHVIPALVRKFVEAADGGKETVAVWGEGDVTRDFVYVSDVAAGMVAAARQLRGPTLVNLASGVETRIADVARSLAAITGFGGKIAWDRSRPQGQPRRSFDISLARERLGWRPRVSLPQGLRLTVDWYRRERGARAGATRAPSTTAH